MVAFDNTNLSLLIFPDADLRQGNEGQKVEHARERVAGLVQSVEDAREQVLVPTPVLCELLVTEGADVQDVLTTLRGSAYIRVESFDERAAVELAMRLRDARRAGDQREGLPITKSAMKFDRQIVAIALVSGASVLYSDDDGVAKFAAGCGLAVKRVADLPVPASQQPLPFQDASVPAAADEQASESSDEPAASGSPSD
jgi:predicted nucleic acid-binding protein